MSKTKHQYHGYWIEDGWPCLVWKVGTSKKKAVRCNPPQVEAIIDSVLLGDNLGDTLSSESGQTYT